MKRLQRLGCWRVTKRNAWVRLSSPIARLAVGELFVVGLGLTAAQYSQNQLAGWRRAPHLGLNLQEDFVEPAGVELLQQVQEGGLTEGGKAVMGIGGDFLSNWVEKQATERNQAALPAKSLKSSAANQWFKPRKSKTASEFFFVSAS